MGSIQQDLPSFLYCENDVTAFPKGKTMLDHGHRNLFGAQMAEFIRSVRFHEQPSRNSIQDSLLLIETQEQIKRRINQQ